MADTLAKFIERARTWPQAAQEEAVAALQAIEEEIRRPYALSDDDREVIDRGLADAEAGRFVPEEEVARLFARFRNG
jgi:predicted transcriptional regulator